MSGGLDGAWKPGANLKFVRFKPLPRQEAIAWLPDASGVLFGTEANNRLTAPLLWLRCEG